MNMDAKDRSPATSADRNASEDIDDIADRATNNGGAGGAAAGPGPTGNGNGPKKSSSKDPSRPRRKKARRACFACQRAHLTCGDERPCQRCIKRGLQDACHDGVRKKAKYLHDAPDGALMPGVTAGNVYNAPAPSAPSSSMSTNALPLSRNGANGGVSATNPSQPNSAPNFYSNPQPNSYNIYPENTMNHQNPFTQSPVSPTFNLKSSAAGQNPTLSSSSVSQQPPPPPPNPATTGQNQNPMAGPFFDPSDPALFNFDLSSMNFENRYGALEFGMLGHMATGAGDSPSDSATQRGSMGRSGSAQFSTTPITGSGAGFGESPGGQQPFMFGDPLLNDWSNSGQGQNPINVYAQMSGSHLAKPDAPHAFAIESGPATFSSPSVTASPHAPANNNFEDSTSGSHAHSASNNHHHHAVANKSNGLAPNGQRPAISTPSLKQQSLNVGGVKRRQRNPSSIYESVKEPYAYTSGFHNLTAFIQRRFPPQKTLQIAKALASIRPSFIATTKTLNRDDLIFMERCFQRTLFEYEDFINACGTPTIVCRRTGEIAAVGKEFSILTGWKKDVLLGKEPNLNVNTGGSSSPTSGSSSRGGSFPPRESGNGRPPQPVFLAELLDDDSVVEFYDDFARLAFGDSRGSVMTTCKLLKYKTKEDMEQAQSDDNQRWNNHLRKGGIAGEAGMNQLGFKDGKVECAYCWTVKRDVFDIPMLIVMNLIDNHKPFSPHYQQYKSNKKQEDPRKMRPNESRSPVAGPETGPEPPFPVRLSGPVIKGFGRGSKELGIPTANIPAETLNAYPDLDIGVYYGVVALAPSAPSAAIDGGGTILPAVLSIGYNPFYKNKERSIEIHIMPPLSSPSPTATTAPSTTTTQFHKLPDFYTTPLNLLILGYIRPEYDYVSLEALVEDIRIDCEVARESLRRGAYLCYLQEGEGDSEGNSEVREVRRWLTTFG